MQGSSTRRHTTYLATIHSTAAVEEVEGQSRDADHGEEQVEVQQHGEQTWAAVAMWSWTAWVVGRGADLKG